MGKLRGFCERPLASRALAVFTRSIADMSRTNSNDSAEAPGLPVSIFVVDDEPMLLELACVVLMPLGFRIQTFRSAEAAFEAYRAAEPRPDLIITDYAMHVMTGMTLIEECRHLQPLQKALLVSGTVDERVFRQAPCKPNAFLAKPYKAAQLIHLVRSVLASRPKPPA